MNIIIFTHILEGHHLEYVHHLYQMASYDRYNKYVFLLPESFLNFKEKLDWGEFDHITFDLFKEYNVQNRQVKPLAESYKWSRFVAKKAKKYRADYVFTNTLIIFVPFAPFFVEKPTKLIGIIYRIYLHDIKYRSKMSGLLDRIKYMIMTYSNVFHRILVLNDVKSSDRLNQLYQTDKFVSIPDPYIPIESDKTEDIRKIYNIGSRKTLFVQFGAMNRNKACIEILQSILELPEEKQNEFAFFFAGKVSSGIRKRFYELITAAKDKVQIIVKDEFCSYEFFASLCQSCDAILTPYKRIAQSSGLIGYASQFGKPVIAVNKGLLGQLVKEYELGILIDDNSPENLLLGYDKIARGDFVRPTKRYCEQNNIENFQKKIFEQIK